MVERSPKILGSEEKATTIRDTDRAFPARLHAGSEGGGCGSESEALI